MLHDAQRVAVSIGSLTSLLEMTGCRRRLYGQWSELRHPSTLFAALRSVLLMCNISIVRNLENFVHFSSSDLSFVTSLSTPGSIKAYSLKIIPQRYMYYLEGHVWKAHKYCVNEILQMTESILEQNINSSSLPFSHSAEKDCADDLILDQLSSGHFSIWLFRNFSGAFSSFVSLVHDCRFPAVCPPCSDWILGLKFGAKCVEQGN